MLEAAPATVRFHCPSCGAGLRAARGEGGAVIGCHQCGERVRVPRHLPPRESIPDEPPPFDPATARRARSGLKLLELGLMLAVLDAALVAASYAGWAWWVGPARVLDRDPGDLRLLLLTAWSLDIVLVLTLTAVKWLGYHRCEPLAACVQSGPWATAARYAVLARAAGYLVAAVPWFLDSGTEAVPPVLRAFVQIGQLAWVCGGVFEFGVVLVWLRLFGELGGAGLTRLVTRYLVGVGAALVLGSTALSFASFLLVLTLRRSSPPPPPGHPPVAVQLDYAQLSPDAWLAFGALAAAFGLAGLALAWRYRRILRVAYQALGPLAPRP